MLNAHPDPHHHQHVAHSKLANKLDVEKRNSRFKWNKIEIEFQDHPRLFVQAALLLN